MIRMPVTADVAVLFGLFHHLSNGWVAGYVREKAIYVDLPPTFGKGKMRLGRQVLIFKKQYFMVCKGLLQFAHLLGCYLTEINALN